MPKFWKIASSTSRHLWMNLLKRCECPLVGIPAIGVPTHCNYRYSSSNKNSSTLSISTLLLQDGLEIHEMPLVMKMLTSKDVLHAQTFSSPLEVRRETEEESQFYSRLRDCSTMSQVLQLLEVPSSSVTSYSAAFALQRLANLFLVSEDTDIHSFVRKAVLSELCDTVLKEVNKLTASALFELIHCCTTVDFLSSDFVNALDTEIESRIGDSCLTVVEICQAITLYSLPKCSEEILHNLWIHLSNRHNDIDETNISKCYEVLPLMSPRHKYVHKILDKAVKHCWWKLSSKDVGLICKTLAMCNYQSAHSLTRFARWIFLNVHTVQDSELVDIMTAYTHFHFMDVHLIHTLERYVEVKASRQLSKTLVAQVMEYFRSQRYLSTRVMNAVAKDIESSGHLYSEKQLLYALRPFGHLNYTPVNAAKFFHKIEDLLMTRFNDFDPHSMLEMLASFVYLQRLPINFISKVFTPHYQAKLRSIPDIKLQKNAFRHLLEVQASLNVEYPGQRQTSFFGSGLNNLNVSWIDSSLFRIHQEIGMTLMEILGPANVKDVEVPNGTPHMINFVLKVKDRSVLPVDTTEDDEYVKKLAVIILPPTSFCVNAPHLLGGLELKMRHLEKLGYIVIKILTTDYYSNGRRAEHRQGFVKHYLAEEIDFTNHNEIIFH